MNQDRILKRLRMIPDLNPATLMMLIFGVSTFIFIMFLPALLELKKPRDAGPRLIMDASVVTGSQERMKTLTKMEDGAEIDRNLAKKLADIIAVLPNLES
ncbi:hypothetical protein MUO83_07225 [Candidatus Bathyarchaeota archaeon]|jgi:hypothetical protein|nr:hypothetical protein [Candidatus Bathyarchaeota archaeon]